MEKGRRKTNFIRNPGIYENFNKFIASLYMILFLPFSPFPHFSLIFFFCSVIIQPFPPPQLFQPLSSLKSFHSAALKSGGRNEFNFLSRTLGFVPDCSIIMPSMIIFVLKTSSSVLERSFSATGIKNKFAAIAP